MHVSFLFSRIMMSGLFLGYHYYQNHHLFYWYGTSYSGCIALICSLYVPGSKLVALIFTVILSQLFQANNNIVSRLG